MVARVGGTLHSHELCSIMQIACQWMLIGGCCHESRVSVDGRCILYWLFVGGHPKLSNIHIYFTLGGGV